jgi:hypothetical protein
MHKTIVRAARMMTPLLDFADSDDKRLSVGVAHTQPVAGRW